MSREAGKGDRNRSIGQKYRNGYDLINWGKKNVHRQAEAATAGEGQVGRESASAKQDSSD